VGDKLTDLVPKGLRVEFFRWEEIWGKGQLHPRYVITEYAGIRIDGGLDAKPEGTDTEASLTEPAVFEEAPQGLFPSKLSLQAGRRLRDSR
jgi:hypothetical protein